MNESRMKFEIEKKMKIKIPWSLFDEAAKCATDKQQYIYEHEYREVVKQDWYLQLLIEEYLESIIFSNYTARHCAQ